MPVPKELKTTVPFPWPLFLFHFIYLLMYSYLLKIHFLIVKVVHVYDKAVKTEVHSLSPPLHPTLAPEDNHCFSHSFPEIVHIYYTYTPTCRHRLYIIYKYYHTILLFLM